MKIKKFNENNQTQPHIFKKQVVYSVDCSDLEYFIKNLYGKYPEIVASLELGDDDTFEISASSTEIDEKEFNRWISRPSHSRSEIYMLMNKLASDGYIENGDYLIKTY